ncbi:hypothetical protein HELRODRAFT_188309 [Helobdella robusta]|uniref:Sphingolipid delta4-desaturase N-terminal domain-containing protein n=1 Tax=Helobdella robusta TaxID=6412 RepID=T1FPV0_HELRO|nr:hypothetical protein HELRODRAFT_188309 [Helobdella robusta]ESO06255.1 hypothetical protein HELRODRAFT_188309 [Helobdella robusta]
MKYDQVILLEPSLTQQATQVADRRTWLLQNNNSRANYKAIKRFSSNYITSLEINSNYSIELKNILKKHLLTMRQKITDRFGELFDRFIPLGFKVDHPDEKWLFKEEPHVQRRKAILKDHPEVKNLMGYDTTLAFAVLFIVSLQFFVSFVVVREASWPVLLLLAYVVGATCNHSLGAAIHEIGHNLAFGHSHILANRILGMFANLPWGIPMSVTYKKYHTDHHLYMGHDTLDVDIPTVIESYLFRHPITKIIWLLVHPVIHGLRPYFKSPKPIWKLEVVNFIVQISFDLFVLYVFGIKSLSYFVAGSLLGQGGLHPLTGHFFSEHYLYIKGQATVSYYGPLNFFMFNLGYHVEHHDFPYIPYRKLPELKKMCPEYYDDLPYHTSWVKVIWDFVWDSDMGPHARGVGYLPEGRSEVDILNSDKKK